ncbi:HutD/Ves family protein [Methylovirgula sp. 4M-Z18]|uniref:HutD/Ves family protein n=1 Tax=Methylovirgula sp. 4M-Z18 TaxID=2293567 RepID=UPI000E2F971A|nr:HutD family protein [Methylovirgula sp. 4M-Z18]RFB78627.1 HutD family protein [Methylovirgula sp. 4M-Z18]
MRLIPASSYTSMPWKNGGGVTTEIAVYPEGAGLETFEWRVSTAHVASDGPFSLFPNIDRTLSVLNGGGIVLHGGETVSLTPQTMPYAFAADTPVSAALIDGAIDDLNVMTRRGEWTHSVKCVDFDSRWVDEALDDLVLIYCAAGHISLARDEVTGGTLVLEKGEQAELSADGASRIYVIGLNRG